MSFKNIFIPFLNKYPSNHSGRDIKDLSKILRIHWDLIFLLPIAAMLEPWIIASFKWCSFCGSYSTKTWLSVQTGNTLWTCVLIHRVGTKADNIIIKICLCLKLDRAFPELEKVQKCPNAYFCLKVYVNDIP